MGMLYNRLLIILNEESQESTYYHIAVVMLEHIEELMEIPINKLAELCDVSKSTISKFIRFIGYDDYAEFRYSAMFEDNKYNYNFNYVNNVMKYIEDCSMDHFVDTIQNDIAATYRNLDWNAIDRLVKDLVQYKRVAAFGLMFSETAAMDLQSKLGYNKKFIVTNMNDLKQDHFIQNAGEDTLIIVFSDSGEFINKYQRIEDFAYKRAFSVTRARVVLITSNQEMEKDPRVDYCIFYRKTSSLCTHRIVYGLLTDIIAYKYRQYIQNTQSDI
ncbi:MAG: MurR/RpiR family transcriptional regulator [Lachnospiraceae bacterium]